MIDTRNLLMTKEEIEAYNERILKYEKANVVDLSKVPLQMEVAKVIALIEQYDFGSYEYINGRCFDEDARKRLLAKRNLESLNCNKANLLESCWTTNQSKAAVRNNQDFSTADLKISVQFGIVTAPADVRSFPAMDVLMESKDEWRFDYFQETKLRIGEGVCIYHHTEDGQWLFVQARNYAGWVQSSCIQKCTREAMIKRIEQSSAQGKIDSAAQSSAQGMIDSAAQSSVHSTVESTEQSRFLPYTTANVIKQAFQYLNTPYSWGNKGCGLDCSGVMLAVYESFGFSFPRNTSAMAACKDLLIDVSNLDSYEKKQVLKTVLPGSMLLMNGHVVMYLGVDANNVYALHAFSKYFDDKGNRIEVMACAITTMDIKRKDGSTFLDAVHAIWQILPKKNG